MSCYDTIVYTTYPKGCATTEPSPFSLPLASDDLYYSGPNLPYTGIQTNTDLTEALQRIDTAIGESEQITPSEIYLDVTISASRLQTIQATPEELIAAPGSGKAIFVTSGYVIQKSVTSDYSTGGSFALTQGTQSVFTIGSLRQAAEFPKSYLMRVGFVTTKSFYIEDAYDNKALTLTNSSALSADGDGYLIIRIYYKIITL